MLINKGPSSPFWMGILLIRKATLFFIEFKRTACDFQFRIVRIPKMQTVITLCILIPALQNSFVCCRDVCHFERYGQLLKQCSWYVICLSENSTEIWFMMKFKCGRKFQCNCTTSDSMKRRSGMPLLISCVQTERNEYARRRITTAPKSASQEHRIFREIIFYKT